MNNEIKIFPVPLDCQDTWDLICRGDTDGCFQIRSGLGKSWCQKIQPRNIEELSAVVSLVRPGCLKAMEPDSEGKLKSLTQHYADRKNGEALVEFLHPAIDPILQPTYNVIVYQEQAIKIAVAGAGFTPVEADNLRKAMGKKDAELMNKVKATFIEKAKSYGVLDEDLAAKLFSWIEKSNRYSFNKSHAVSYAITAYQTAYLKQHYPIQFYASWLHFGLQNQDPFEEIATMANDAKLHNIDVSVPALWLANKNFKIHKDRIVCGMIAVKDIGAAQIRNLRESIKNLPDTPTWYDVVFCLGDPLSKGTISSRCFLNLIKVGTFDFCNKSRKSMIKEYEIWNTLTEKEQVQIIEKYRLQPAPLADILSNSSKLKSLGGICANKNRVGIVESLVTSLTSNTYSLEDTPGWIAGTEKYLLGLSITCSSVDACDTFGANCSCKEFINKEVMLQEGYALAVSIEQIRDLKIKNGKNAGKKMAYLTVGDGSGIISNVVVFSDEFEKFNELLTEGNHLLLSGIRDRNQNTLVVKGVKQL